MKKKASGDLEQVVAVAVYTFVRAAIAGGMLPATALRLTAFMMIESALGREATVGLGLRRSTAARWRSELASLDASLINPDEVPAEMLNDLMGLMPQYFGDLRIIRKPRGEVNHG